MIKELQKEFLKSKIFITEKTELKNLNQILNVLKLKRTWDGVMILQIKNIIINKLK